MIHRILERALAAQEGRKKDVYRDSRGFWSIGVGHCISEDPHITEDEARALVGAPWTDEQIDEEFQRDVDIAIGGLNRAAPWVLELPELVREGLYDMTFQMGLDRCLGFHDMWASLRARDYPGAEEHALDSLWHKQTPARCEQVAAMIGNRGGHG